MLGLDAAGKTSKELVFFPLFDVTGRPNSRPTAILYKLKLNQSVTTIPTGPLCNISRRFPPYFDFIILQLVSMLRL